MPTVRLPIRELVEFLLRTGSIDSRFTGFDRANEGARIHRKLQKAAGEGYAAEVFLSAQRTVEDITFTLEGRADGIFTDPEGTVVIDEIKTTALPTPSITENWNPCHWAQGIVYGAIYAGQNRLERLDVRLTYYQIDTDEIVRYIRHFTAPELEAFLLDLLRQYLPWARRQLDWTDARHRSLNALAFPYPSYRPGQRALAGEVWRACTAGRESSKNGTRLFCQAPTGIGKTMSALFPALKAIGAGKGEKIFYLTARSTTRAAAEDALARLHRSAPGLALRSVTLSAKEKVCLCPDAEGHPACLPEFCPYARGYYERVRTALAALLDGAGSFDRDTLAAAARQYTVCPFELGLDLSEWCDVIIGDYNYLFDPTVHLRRFFDGPGDYLFLIDEAHNLPDRARAMYSARFVKSSLTQARRALGRGKSSLKTAPDPGRQGFSGLSPGRGNRGTRPAHRTGPRRKPQPDQPAGNRSRHAGLPPAPAALRTGGHRVPEGTAPGASPPPCSACRPRCRTGWKPTRRPRPTPGCWNCILPCRTLPAPPSGTTSISSPGSRPGAASWNGSCSVWTPHLSWTPAFRPGGPPPSSAPP